MEVMQMGTLRHRKPIVSKPADRKITIKKPKTPGKFGKFARRLGLVAGITTGIIAPSLSNAQGSIKTQVNKPTDKQTEIMMAAAGERSLPRNTYIVPARDGKDSLRGYAPDRNEKRIEPGSDPKKKYTSSADIEHLDYYIPSDIEIDATRSCIMIKARSVKNFDGTILKASEKSCYFYYPSEEEWKTLGASGFDGTEKKILIGNSKIGYKHVILRSDWNAILVIEGPELINAEDGKIPTSTYEIKPHTDCKWTKDDNGSFLIATPEGVGGIVLGSEGRLRLLEGFKVKKMDNPEFIDYDGKTVFKCSNSKSYLEIYRDSDSKINGDMKIVEVD